MEQKDRMCVADNPARGSGAVRKPKKRLGACHSRRKPTDWEKGRGGDTGGSGGIKSRVVRFNNKNTESPVKFEFQINREQCFTIRMSHEIFGISIYFKKYSLFT